MRNHVFGATDVRNRFRICHGVQIRKLVGAMCPSFVLKKSNKDSSGFYERVDLELPLLRDEHRGGCMRRGTERNIGDRNSQGNE